MKIHRMFIDVLLTFTVICQFVISDDQLSPNFQLIRRHPDGELERRVHRGRVTAREMTDSTGLNFVQITDGRRHFVQAIYDASGQLKDCEYVRDDVSVDDFLNQFQEDFKKVQMMDDVDSLEDDSLENIDESELKLNTTIIKLLRRGDVRKSVVLKRLVDYKGIRDECRKLQARLNNKKQAKSLSTVDSVRRKRELFIYPGTNWCGAGTTSNGFTDLGWYAAADRCCRQHDHCAKTIAGFATKYNLFNYRFHTISDCECDERFRTCLKMLNNEHSNLVGKIFFNVMQMKCFKLKNEKVCQKRSWWGRCLKQTKKQTAQLKDPLPY